VVRLPKTSESNGAEEVSAYVTETRSDGRPVVRTATAARPATTLPLPISRSPWTTVRPLGERRSRTSPPAPVPVDQNPPATPTPVSGPASIRQRAAVARAFSNALGSPNGPTFWPRGVVSPSFQRWLARNASGSRPASRA